MPSPYLITSGPTVVGHVAHWLSSTCLLRSVCRLQLLPHDVEARRSFVQSGGLQFLQVRGPDATLAGIAIHSGEGLCRTWRDLAVLVCVREGVVVRPR